MHYRRGMLPPRDDDSSAIHPRRTTGQPHHFAFVDALRGFAILGVIMLHCSYKMKGLDHTLSLIAAKGQYGVQLFFVISAFTLFWSLHSRMAVDRKPIRAFFIRRLFRIAPLFYAGILFYLMFPDDSRLTYAPLGITWIHVALTALFLHGWWPTTITSIVPGGWSIAAEVMFYLCIPLLYRTIKSLRAAVWLTLISASIVSLLTAWVTQWAFFHFPIAYDNILIAYVFFTFPSQIPVFCAGLVLYFLFLEQMKNEAAPHEHHASSRRADGVLLVGSALALMMVNFLQHLWYAATFVLLAVGLAKGRFHLLVNRATRFIGKVSYSAYIWHFCVLQHIQWIVNDINPSPDAVANYNLQFVTLFLAMLLLTIPIATLSYYLIEAPSQRLGKYVIARLEWGAPVRAEAGLNPST